MTAKWPRPNPQPAPTLTSLQALNGTIEVRDWMKRVRERGRWGWPALINVRR